MTTYFITGATGVVGSAVAEQLLRETDANVQLLIRAASELELRSRLQRLLEFWNIPREKVADRVSAVRGDTTAARLGLAPQAYEHAVRSCTHVIHCAAAVRMNLPLEEARRSAVTGTQTVLALMRAGLQQGVLQKAEFVSTVGVAGRLPGALPERWIGERREFHNTYEASKAEAEELIAVEAESGLPVTVHRPSMVVGDSRTGRVLHFQIFYHLAEFLSGCRTHGLFPELGDAQLDVVPVDYVASAIRWSSTRAQVAGRVLHLCAGPHAAVYVDDLRARVRARFAAAGIRLPRQRTIPARWFKTAIALASRVAPGRNRRALATLPIFLDYLAERQRFENARTVATLDAAGIRMPAIGPTLDRALDYYLDCRRR